MYHSTTQARDVVNTPELSLDSVKAYYDERIEGKIRDFTHFNPRIEAAIHTLAEWAPIKPKRVLEIGCGIGATTWRMARAWPDAEVIGADVSPASIQVAKKCFVLSNLRYLEGLISAGSLSGQFDLIVLMDTYEHIALQDRASLHAVIKSLLANDSRVVLTFPTPATQQHDRIHALSAMQPIDEDVTPADIIRLAQETETHILYYRQVGIWQYGDFAHLVLGRFQLLAEVQPREPNPTHLSRLKQTLKRVVGRTPPKLTEQRDYLGSDLLQPAPRNYIRPFDVSAAERRHIINTRFQRNL
jgi:2-polyprenyl-3-methyl-5-hydroxy-6-metoxy-1,4-benzoquinol methylase